MRSEDSRRRSQGAGEDKRHRQTSLSQLQSISAKREKEERFPLLSLFGSCARHRGLIYISPQIKVLGELWPRKKNRALTNYDAHQMRVCGKYHFAQPCSFWEPATSRNHRRVIIFDYLSGSLVCMCSTKSSPSNHLLIRTENFISCWASTWRVFSLGGEKKWSTEQKWFFHKLKFT